MYHFMIPLVVWHYYNPMTFLLANFQDFINSEPQLFRVLVGLHDFAINFLLAIPFAFVAIRVVKGNILKPIIIATIVVFFIMHRQSFEALSYVSETSKISIVISIVAGAIQLPLALATVMYFQRQKSAPLAGKV